MLIAPDRTLTTHFCNTALAYPTKRNEYLLTTITAITTHIDNIHAHIPQLSMEGEPGRGAYMGQAIG